MLYTGQKIKSKILNREYLISKIMNQYEEKTIISDVLNNSCFEITESDIAKHYDLI